MLKLEKFKNKELKQLDEIKGGAYLLHTFDSGRTISAHSIGYDASTGNFNWEFDFDDCIDDFRSIDPREITHFGSEAELMVAVNK
jgi:hypothetical protein